ncbi:MAG: hypothetical protein IIY22_05960, partial [Erysipelotrichaceae bacterium]|nr:hypothetical protein [Erysipelotrichaceae bacterium]
LNTFSAMDEAEDFWKEFGKRYNFTLKDKPAGGYQQDPWIMIFKNRLKFVQDFSKGVQDMNKYMSETDAIAKMRETMEGRGLSLGFNGKDDIAVTSMTGSRAEVMKWYDDTIKKIQDKIAEKGGAAWRGLGVQAILAKDTKSRMIKAWQDLLAEVFKQKTDFDLSQTKKDFETAMKKLKDEIKRSDVARNFYQDILDLTGNKELATNLTVGIYGEVGESFQKLVDKELQQAMNELDPTKFDWADWGDLSYGIATQDFSIINKYLDKFPEAWRDRLKEMAADNEKFNADFIKGLYQRYKDEESFENRKENVRRVEHQKDLDQRHACVDVPLHNHKYRPARDEHSRRFLQDVLL